MYERTRRTSAADRRWPRGPHRFVRRKDAEERVGGGSGRIELGQRGLRAGERGLSACSLDVGFAHAEVDSLPREECTRGAAQTLS